MAFAERPVNPAHLELRHYRRVEDGADVGLRLLDFHELGEFGDRHRRGDQVALAFLDAAGPQRLHLVRGLEVLRFRWSMIRKM